MKIEDITVPTPGPSPSGAGKQRSLAEGERNFQQTSKLSFLYLLV